MGKRRAERPDGQALVDGALARGAELSEHDEAALLDAAAAFRTLYYGMTSGAHPLPESVAQTILVNHAIAALNAAIGIDDDE